MIGVKIKDNEALERGIGRLKRIVEDAGVLSEIKNRRHYEKPSVEKRRKLKAAIRKAKMKDMPPKKSRRKRRSQTRASQDDSYSS